MAAAFGVHLGATSACLAVFKDGRTDVVANESGDRVSPAIVAYTDHDQTVGLAAKQGMIRNASNTVCNVKQIIGRSFSDPLTQNFIKNNQVKVVESNGNPVFDVSYRDKQTKVSPTSIACLVYKHLRETAERHGEGDIHDAVLAVPTSFDQNQKQQLRKAATEAGFSVLRMISEPASVLLAYDVGQTDPHSQSTVLVYRLGGTGLEVSLMEVHNGMYRLVDSIEDRSVSGHAFTQILVDRFAEDFKREFRMDMRDNKRSVYKLRAAADHCKHILTSVPTARSLVESLYEGMDYNCQITRARFEGLCSSLVDNCLRVVGQLLEKCNVNKSQIDKVVLCGGGSKMPCMQSAIQDYLPSAEMLSHLAGDEVIAIGAAKQAAILTGNEHEESNAVEDQCEIPCLDRAISVQVNGATELDSVFSRLTPVPCRRELKLPITESGQCDVILTQSSTETFSSAATESRILAKINLRDLPTEQQVSAVFHYRSDGCLHLTCTERSTNTVQSVTVEAC